MTGRPEETRGGPRGREGTMTYALTLFVTGHSIRSERAVANLRRLCQRLGDRCELTIVDVLERPELAERDKVLATPTVVRTSPLPRRRIIGDLSDEGKVVLELDLPLAADDAEAS
jgi:circadian clock protein KaiB